MNLTERAQRAANALLPLYQELHRQPELAGSETRTARLVAAELTAVGAEVITGIGGEGVVGVLRRGTGPVVMLRADMDALPIAEDTGAEYASTVSDPPAMHACGHDLHVSCLVGAARLLAEDAAGWRGTAVFLAQPAEETLSGARAMLEDGLLERIPTPDVAIAQHVWPSPVGEIRHRSGAIMASCDNITITVHGVGGHGSRREGSVDPVLIAAHIVTQLHALTGSVVPARGANVLTVGSVSAGATHNVIPDSATIKLTLRTCDATDRSRLLDGIRKITRATCDGWGSPQPPEFDTTGDTPGIWNDVELTAQVRADHAREFGAGVILDKEPGMGSEDFAEFWAHGIRSVYYFIGVLDHATCQAGNPPYPHTPQFLPRVPDALAHGIRALTTAALGRLVATDRGDADSQ